MIAKRGQAVNAQISAFLDALVSGADPAAAWKGCGLPGDAKNGEAEALLKQPIILREFHSRVRAALQVDAGAARRVLLEIMHDPEASKAVRVKAADIVLSRAGVSAPKDGAGAGDTPLNEMSTEQLRAVADKLETEIAARAQDVSGPAKDAKLAQVDDLI